MPIGLMEDMIACYQIMHGAKRKKRPILPTSGSSGDKRDIDDILFETLR